jgi:uncharacterized protein with PIN domain
MLKETLFYEYQQIHLCPDCNARLVFELVPPTFDNGQQFYDEVWRCPNTKKIYKLKDLKSALLD